MASVTGSEVELENVGTTIEEEDDEEKESGEEEEEENIKQELMDMPLGELQKLRGKIGTKKFDAVMRESSGGRLQKQRKFRRDNKNKPREMPSHRPVSRFRHVVPVKKCEARDPRFDERSGQYNPTMFKKAYEFMDGIRGKEKKMAEKALRKTKNPERKSQLHQLLQKMESQKVAEQKREEKRALEREHKKAERQLQRDGKKPFFLKKSVQKQLELADKYKELKRTGKLDKYLTKKRKRNAKRDRRQLPFKREQ